jgi:AraC-like DNA-binding protein
MHLTPRTLIRRLNEEQQSYKSILRDLRREYARALLANAALTVAEAGEILGYREPANFGRAFRAWYGTSPSAWRRSGQ